MKSLVLLSLISIFTWSFFEYKDYKTKKAIGILPDSTLYSNVDFADIFLDSNTVNQFLIKYQVSDSVSFQIKEFYNRRNYQFAWLKSNELNSSVEIFVAQLHSFAYEFQDNSLKNSELDTLLLAADQSPETFLNNKTQTEQLELLLTSTFFKYSKKVYGGIDRNTFDLEWFIPRKKKNYQILLDSLVTNAKDIEQHEPLNRYYLALKAKLKQYRGIQKNGGLPKIEIQKEDFKVGDTIPDITVLKKYLFLVNDIVDIDTTDIVTQGLLNGIQRFQHRMGLKENSKLDKNTILELNKPLEERIQQIMVNLERLRWVPVEMEKDYLLVNIPEFKLHVFKNNDLVWETNVVVGKVLNKTSIFKGNISKIVFNPYWGIPKSIVRNEILPKIKRDPNYLARNNMEIVNGYYRQKPGKNNALGKMKFLFPNQYSIYLHDTPSKSLFELNNRAFSHGCIRVKNPKHLAMLLLENNADWPETKVDQVLKSIKETHVIIKPTVPVYIAYFTSWVDNTGLLNFRKDIYGLDAKLAKEIFSVK